MKMLPPLFFNFWNKPMTSTNQATAPDAKERAFHFWHEHAGKKLGVASAMESLTCGYPTTKKDGTLHMRRMGAKGGFILVDKNQAIIQDALRVDDFPATVADIQVIQRVDTSIYSSDKSVLTWMIDPVRSFPFLAIELSIATNAIKHNLRLTESPRAAMLISAKGVLRFDIDQVRTMLALINKCESTRDWMRAAKAKSELETAPRNLSDSAYKFNLKNMVAAFEKLGDMSDMPLPAPGTDLFRVLEVLTYEKAAINFNE
jgi:hypothetical protein